VVVGSLFLTFNILFIYVQNNTSLNYAYDKIVEEKRDRSRGSSSAKYTPLIIIIYLDDTYCDKYPFCPHIIYYCHCKHPIIKKQIKLK
jgi:hypothetical protein